MRARSTFASLVSDSRAGWLARRWGRELRRSSPEADSLADATARLRCLVAKRWPEGFGRPARRFVRAGKGGVLPCTKQRPNVLIANREPLRGLDEVDGTTIRFTRQTKQTSSGWNARRRRGRSTPAPGRPRARRRGAQLAVIEDCAAASAGLVLANNDREGGKVVCHSGLARQAWSVWSVTPTRCSVAVHGFLCLGRYPTTFSAAIGSIAP